MEFSGLNFGDKMCPHNQLAEVSDSEINGSEIMSKSVCQTKLNQVGEIDIYPNVVETFLLEHLENLQNFATMEDENSNPKKVRLARETLDKYTTLAGRLGFKELQDQLEDVSFLLLNPEAREDIIEKLKLFRVTTSNEEISIEMILEELKEVFYDNNFPKFAIQGREKSPFSIWQKMCRKRIKFEEILDIIAFRIIVKTVQDCYKVIEILHKAFTPLQGRFKDYIQWSKGDTYKSLHTGIIGPFGKVIEVQVRTEEMNEDIALNLYFNYWRQKTNYY